MSDLDALLAEDPLNLSSQDIDSIILHMRKMRGEFDAGIKPKKDKGPKISLEAVRQELMAPKEPFKRRF